MARVLRTSKQNIYIQLVKNAEPVRGEDENEEAQESENESYLFNYQYELFSFAAAQGFLHQEIIEEPEEWSQDIIRMSNMDPGNEHTKAIELMAKLVEIEEDVDSEEAWDLLLRYADAGVEMVNEGLSVQEDFDMVRYVKEADGEAWFERLRDAVGDPDEVETRI